MCQALCQAWGLVVNKTKSVARAGFQGCSLHTSTGAETYKGPRLCCGCLEILNQSILSHKGPDFHFPLGSPNQAAALPFPEILVG